MNLEDQINEHFTRISEGAYSGLFRIELNMLQKPDVGSLTKDFSFHPLIQQLDGMVLDDPNTSNRHVLLRRYPFGGHILYLAHDDNSRVVFPSVASLLDTAEIAKARGLSLPELHPAMTPRPANQDAVSKLIDSLVNDGEIDVALCLIPSMDLFDVSLLTRLASHEDVYLGEAVADEIALRPSATLQSVALICSKHPHPQAANAGVRALKAIAA